MLYFKLTPSKVVSVSLMVYEIARPRGRRLCMYASTIPLVHYPPSCLIIPDAMMAWRGL